MGTAAQTLKGFIKSGEGSRGGHIIGHLASGKAIYAASEKGRRKALMRLYLHHKVNKIGRSLDGDYAKAAHQTDPIAIERHYAAVNAKVAKLNYIRQKLGLVPLSAYR